MTSRSPFDSVRVDAAAGGGQGVFAARDLAAGEFIGRFEGTVTARRTRMSLQFGPLSGPPKHVEPAEENPLRFLNHACDPNAAFRDLDLFATQSLSAGTEITIDYNVHEDELAHPFECRCGSPRCVGWVRGRSATTSRG